MGLANYSLFFLSRLQNRHKLLKILKKWEVKAERMKERKSIFSLSFSSSLSFFLFGRWSYAMGVSWFFQPFISQMKSVKLESYEFV